MFYLKKAGFQGPYSGGKHQYMVKDNLKLTIPNPHQGDVSLGLLTRVLKRAKINKDDWEQL
ncbi:type II toxin-antitoxin system HicA family toxin [Crocosphaera chwakensis]|nr:type II toxin-antitoxin system HicA family toxin [Crocosphaera chwakensis]